jgi:excinuclease UvrABC nuclease subunit
MMSTDQILALITETENKMKKAAKELDFITAAQYRDEVFAKKETKRRSNEQKYKIHVSALMDCGLFSFHRGYIGSPPPYQKQK